MKRLSILFCLILIAAALTACGVAENGSSGENDAVPVAGDSGEEGATSPPQESGDITISKSFGSYTIPSGWVEVQHGSPDKAFYVQSGHEEDQYPDNISINVGTNPYTEEEHERFREAILAQLNRQTGGKADVQVFGDGTTSEQGYILYIFTLEDPQATTKQFYLVGDNKFCLIHLTNFSDSQEADEAAQQMTDSFVWAEE